MSCQYRSKMSSTHCGASTIFTAGVRRHKAIKDNNKFLSSNLISHWVTFLVKLLNLVKHYNLCTTAAGIYRKFKCACWRSPTHSHQIKYTFSFIFHCGIPECVCWECVLHTKKIKIFKAAENAEFLKNYLALLDFDRVTVDYYFCSSSASAQVWQAVSTHCRVNTLSGLVVFAPQWETLGRQSSENCSRLNVLVNTMSLPSLHMQ